MSAVLSGRVGFELVAKAAVAGMPVLAAVGAPTDLAVRTAERFGVTLVGFLRDGAGNVYSHPHRSTSTPPGTAPAARPRLARTGGHLTRTGAQDLVDRVVARRRAPARSRSRTGP
jgi:hypothetical protein